MKKYLLICLSLLLACMPAACQTDRQDQPSPPAPAPAMPTESAAYIYWYDTWLPISLVRQGEQLLQNDSPEWYFDIQDGCGQAYDAPQPADTALHLAARAYAGSNSPFANVGPDNEGWLTSDWLGADIMQKLAVQGDWQPFCTPVRYEVYTVEAQPPVPALWQEHFQSLLGEAAANTPLIVKDAAYFDIDGDGLEEAVVNFGNRIRRQVPANAANLPAGTICTDYSICSYFSGDGQALCLERDITAHPNRPLSEAEEVFYAYRPPAESDAPYYEQWTAVYQYNADGDCVACPFYNMGEYDFWPELLALPADIDGDGLPELLTAACFIYYPIEVYKIDKASGLPVRQFAVNTPA